MKWKIIDNRTHGQERIITKFLYLPTSIGSEYRWFEKATIKQKLHRGTDVTCGASWWEWRNVEWLD